MVEYLLAKGASPYSCDHEHRSVLVLAVMGGSRSMIDLLMKRGASLLTTNCEGRTVLHYLALGTQRAARSRRASPYFERLDFADDLQND